MAMISMKKKLKPNPGTPVNADDIPAGRTGGDLDAPAIGGTVQPASGTPQGYGANGERSLGYARDDMTGSGERRAVGGAGPYGAGSSAGPLQGYPSQSASLTGPMGGAALSVAYGYSSPRGGAKSGYSPLSDMSSLLPEPKYRSLYAQNGGETYNPYGGKNSFSATVQPRVGQPITGGSFGTPQTGGRLTPTIGDIGRTSTGGTPQVGGRLPQGNSFSGTGGNMEPDIGTPPGMISGPMGSTPQQQTFTGVQPDMSRYLNIGTPPWMQNGTPNAPGTQGGTNRVSMFRQPVTGNGTFSEDVGDVSNMLDDNVRISGDAGDVRNALDVSGADNILDILNRPDYAANGAGLYSADEVSRMMDESGLFFSDADRRLAQQYPEFGVYAIKCKQDYANATTPEARALANANLEAMRAKLGSYYGGSDGSEYNPFGNEGEAQPGVGARPTYDPTQTGEMPTYDPTSAGEMPGYDPGSVGERPTYDPTGLGEKPTYDPTGLGERPTYDPTGLGDAPTYDPMTAGERPEWDDAGNRGGVDDMLQRIRDFLDKGYDDPYAQQIQDQLQSILGRDPFSYDYNTDPVWQAYKKQYTREGQRSSADALAQAAAMTGGVPSSYAQTAAQQAGNYYASQLSDKIPELYQQAYGRYQDEGNTMMNNMNLLRGLSNDAYGRYGDDFSRIMSGYDAERTNYNDAYGRYRDTVSDWNNDRNFSYNQYLDALNQWNNNRNFGYNQYRDSMSDWLNDRNFGYNQYLDQLGQWNTDRNFDYNKYLDLLNQYNNDRNFNYNQWRDQVGDWRDNRNFGYDRWRDQMGDWRDNRNFGYDQWRDQMSDWLNERSYNDSRSDLDWNRRLQAAQLRASLGDYSGYDELFGTNLQELYRQQLAQGGGGYSGRSGDGEDGDGSDDIPVNLDDILALGRGPLSAEQALKIAEEKGYQIVMENGEWRIKKPGDNGAVGNPFAGDEFYKPGRLHGLG